MYLEPKLHSAGNFKLWPRLYENERKFTVYYNELTVGEVDTDKPQMETKNSLAFYICAEKNSQERVGTIWIHFYLEHGWKLEFAELDFNINTKATKKLSEKFISTRQVIIEKRKKKEPPSAPVYFANFRDIHYGEAITFRQIQNIIFNNP